MIVTEIIPIVTDSDSIGHPWYTFYQDPGRFIVFRAREHHLIQCNKLALKPIWARILFPWIGPGWWWLSAHSAFFLPFKIDFLMVAFFLRLKGAAQ